MSDDSKDRWRETLELLGLPPETPAPATPPAKAEPPPARVERPTLHVPPPPPEPEPEPLEEIYEPEPALSQEGPGEPLIYEEEVEVGEVEFVSELPLQPATKPPPAGEEGEDEDRPRRGRRRGRRGRKRGRRGDEAGEGRTPAPGEPGEEAPRGEPVAEGDAPRPAAEGGAEGEKDEKRRRRRRRGGDRGDDRGERREPRGERREPRAERGEPRRERPVRSDDDDAPHEDDEIPVPTPVDVEDDSPIEGFGEWNVPSWNELIASLYRPDR